MVVLEERQNIVRLLTHFSVFKNIRSRRRHICSW